MPITGKKKKELTMDSVLDLITPYDVYKYYFGDFNINQATCNHLRGEKSSSFIIGNKYGELSHFDFGDSYWRGDCFNLVMQKEKCDLNTALHIIDRDFGLGIATDTFKGRYKEIVKEYKQPEITKKNTLIQVSTRKFTKEELTYWNQYHIDVSELRQNNVYSIKTLFFNKNKFPLKDTDLRFGYYYEGFWKIYFPYKSKKEKWLSNVPLQTAGGLDNLDKNKNSLTCKSLKDFMVCKKIHPYTCYVQNESLAAFSEEIVDRIKNNSKICFYGGDSDLPGKQASYKITSCLGFRHINPEDRLLPQIKDFSDWAKIEGLDVVKEHFIKKELFL